MRLPDDFRDFFIFLNKNKVSYMVVGGFAVIHHGYNRHTGDLDIWVEQTPDNFKKLIRAFAEFGFPTHAIDETAFLGNENDVYTFGRQPTSIEILTAVKGLKFEECIGNAERVKLDDVEVNMIDVRDLIKAKKAAGRLQDQVDIEKLSDRKK